MITAQKTRGRRALAAVALGLVALSATGCGAINDQATATEYAASDGVNFTAGDVEVRNLMLVTTGANAETRVLANVINGSDQSAELELGINGSSVTIEIPADTTVPLSEDDHKATVPAAGAIPGSMIPVDVTVGSESTEQSVPVIDGTLEEYRQYLPEGYEPENNEHLKHAEEEEAGHH
ncbi:hypothetical protein [Zhihengliuella sp.]|uniref:hypothetical protein n=1 Tax=Zhihengliuella sp. TaxID=1954483 RepID=UPI0028126DCD|nr:hypothetical protein [Zhihengliuella sp.]